MDKVFIIVRDRMIEMLKRGVVAWQKPWSGGGKGRPINFKSKKPYRGINVWLLAASGFTDPRWMTFKQAQEAGGSVKKGSKGSIIVYYTTIEKKDDAGNVVKRFPYLKYSTVFNAAQIEGIDFPALNTETPKIAPLEAAEAYRNALPGLTFLPEGGNRACYRPTADSINMPARDTFKSAESYYSTLFHEMTHATGHESRLKRDGVVNSDGFGGHAYSFEELVAEMGASFVMASIGMAVEYDNSAAYLDHWLSVLANDRNVKWIVQAASQAQKAADLILGTETPTIAAPDENDDE